MKENTANLIIRHLQVRIYNGYQIQGEQYAHLLSHRLADDMALSNPSALCSVQVRISVQSDNISSWVEQTSKAINTQWIGNSNG